MLEERNKTLLEHVFTEGFFPKGGGARGEREGYFLVSPGKVFKVKMTHI